MRIISVRWQSVANTFAILYAIFGLAAFCFFEFSSAQYLTLPFGILGPFFHLNLNLNLLRSDDLLATAFSGIAEIVAYALTGWITGAVATACFNGIVKSLGGIDAKHISVIDENTSVN
jgi:hypothetical protein